MSAQARRVLKFKPTMPLALESKLVNKYGYAVEQRIHGQFISFVQSAVIRPTSSVSSATVFRPTFGSVVSVARQAELMQRCDNIVDFFPDPYNQGGAIRTRLHNIAQTLPLAERKFIQEYMDDNFPVSHKGL